MNKIYSYFSHFMNKFYTNLSHFMNRIYSNLSHFIMTEGIPLYQKRVFTGNVIYNRRKQFFLKNLVLLVDKKPWFW